MNQQKARPFVKWAGGKTNLLKQYQSYLPDTFNRYYEPFLGGGALFFHLSPDDAAISDANFELINAYVRIRDDVDRLIEMLHEHKINHCREYFLKMRRNSYGMFADLQRTQYAARFIYLNKTCYNGMYRVNSDGNFNISMGKYDNPTVCDERNLRAVSELLRTKNVDIKCNNYYSYVQDANQGDLVYLDPPYVPLNKTSNFVQYTKKGFSLKDQTAVRDLFVHLSEKGVKVAASNTCCDLIKDLYQGFNIHEILAARSVNCKGSKRGKIKELLITNY